MNDYLTPKCLGNLNPNKSMWGNCIRTQNKVYDSNAIAPCLTAEHARHEFKIVEYIK